uniref:Peptidase S11 D-alanyl-D-alanine carboxypeptidase A N-terminal domain-containing protein n=1 Tax=Thermosporothrix sp. COM3 TaxID=2490863 RepID=A0A455SKE8_9CHLR|nr:hypothetical protein KTC_36940 [Thermosporothrix sp. COM3]
MKKKKPILLLALIIVLVLGMLASVLAFTSVANPLLASFGLRKAPVTPTIMPHPTATLTPSPTPSPSPTLEITPTVSSKQNAPVIQAEAAYLFEVNSGKALFQQKNDMPLPVASTTKMMTAVLALENGNPDQRITVPEAAIDHVQGTDASTAQLVAGDVLTLRDLLYGLMLPSGADAAYTIALVIGDGSVDTFIQMMNAKAQALGMTQTHFVDADGLTIEGDVSTSTADDLVTLARYAMTIPLFAEIAKSPAYEVQATSTNHRYTWPSRVTLLSSYEGLLGIKTGYTGRAGYCFVFAAVQDDHYIIGAILHDTSLSQRDIDATALLNWGFAKLKGTL